MVFDTPGIVESAEVIQFRPLAKGGASRTRRVVCRDLCQVCGQRRSCFSAHSAMTADRPQLVCFECYRAIRHRTCAGRLPLAVEFRPLASDLPTPARSRGDREAFLVTLHSRLHRAQIAARHAVDVAEALPPVQSAAAVIPLPLPRVS